MTSEAEQALAALNAQHAREGRPFPMALPADDRRRLEEMAEALGLSVDDMAKWAIIAGLLDAPGLPDHLREQLQAEYEVFKAAIAAKARRIREGLH